MPVGGEPELPDDGEVIVLPGTVDPSSDDGVAGEVTTVKIMWNDNDSARFDSLADGMFSAADDQLLGEEGEGLAALVG